MMRRPGSMSLLAVLAVGFLTIGAQASADEKSHRMAAEDFLKATGIETTFDQIIDQSIDQQAKANPMLIQLKPVMKKFMRQHFNYEVMKDDLIKIHMEEFTEQELKEITAFYRTPVGQKAVKKMMPLQQKCSELGMKRVQENIGELQRMVVEELQKNNSNPQQ
ncbi:DUF2059 domain-containing protein [bacterium]|nr:DUF2059 domain-containing protein [bacterium]